jgi:hypothetical protein
LSSYLSAYIDGTLIMRDGAIELGALETPAAIPLVRFLVLSGNQEIPVTAHGKLAATVFCYLTTIKRRNAAWPQVNINASMILVPNEGGIQLVANHITWHTSRSLRDEAERLIRE